MVARDPTGRIIGYALGAVRGFESMLTRRLLCVSIVAVTARPWLLIDRYVIHMASARLRRLLRFRRPLRKAPGVGISTMCLVALGVDSPARGQGIGARLLKAFERRAGDFRMGWLELSVRRDNETARRLYERAGWCLRTSPRLDGESLSYWKALEAG